VDDLSGTLGLAGSADYVLALRRRRNSIEATLQVTGRDAPEGEYAFTTSEGTWTLSGNGLAEAAAEAQTRRDSKRLGDRALDVLAIVNERAPANHTRAADVAGKPGIENAQARVYLNRLADAERIVKVTTGTYTSVTTVTSVTPPLTSGFTGEVVTLWAETPPSVTPTEMTECASSSGEVADVTDVTVVTPLYPSEAER
jgi:hypothetical protein